MTIQDSPCKAMLVYVSQNLPQSMLTEAGNLLNLNNIWTEAGFDLTLKSGPRRSQTFFFEIWVYLIIGKLKLYWIFIALLMYFAYFQIV